MIATFAATPHRRAYLASALLGALIVLAIGTAIFAWVDLGTETATLEARRDELQTIAARMRAREPGMARAERTLSADPFLPGATPTLAANAMQSRIVALAEECGVTLRSIGTETVTEVDPGVLPHVTLQAATNARIAAVQKFLYRVETELPFVLVDEVAIRSNRTEPPAGAAALDPELEVDLRLIGYLHRKEG
jgi:hypothetical protein